MIRVSLRRVDAAGAFFSLLAGICWGCSGSVGQYLFDHEGMDSRWLVPIRLGAAGIILLVYCTVREGHKIFHPWKTKQDRRDLLIYGLLGVSVCQYLYFLTIQLSTASAATILQDLSPMMILIISCLQQKRLPQLREIAAVVLAFTGVLLIVTHGSLTHLNIPLNAVIAGVLSGVCVTIYNIVPARLLLKFPVILLQGWAFLMGGAAMCVIFRPWTFHYIPSQTGMLGILFVIAVGNVMAFPFYILGVKMIGPEKACLYGFSEPVSAAVIGVLVLGNPFTLWDLAGFICVFLMLAMISLKHRPANPAKRSR